MLLDRIQRHDVVNAILLAVVLLLAGLAVLNGLGRFSAAVGDGMVEATKDTPTTAVTEPDASASSVPVVESDASLPPARPPAEVTVRVGNGARRPGVAGAGTEQLRAAGFAMLSPKNGPTMDDSVVWYIEGYQAEAAAVASILGVDGARVTPLPADPGLPVEGAMVVVVLGVNSTY